MDGRHLGREHRLEVIVWFYILDYRKHKIQPARTNRAIASRQICELFNQALGENRVRRSEGFLE